LLPSSFAAVQRTLRRRLIALTIQEALIHDQKLDIDARNAKQPGHPELKPGKFDRSIRACIFSTPRLERR
jgi:hypothetical protein